MILRQLTLRNYRNYEYLTLPFDENLIFFVGHNAQGKTNIIESIFLSSTGRSHRTTKDKELIKWDQNIASVQTTVDKLSGTSSITILLSNSEKKKILINNNPISRLVELMGHLNTVMFSSEDLKLVNEGPIERRRFMDIELSQIRPRYFYYLQQYNKILTQRNTLLKSIKYNPSLIKTLPVWNEQLAEAGSYIIGQRIFLNSSLQKIAGNVHKKLSNDKEELSIRYNPSVNIDSDSIKDIKQSFLKTLELKEEDDIEKGTTSKGCHRDDMVIFINGKEVRNFGSQGQKRTVVLSIKLAELEFMYNVTGEYPLLLLDDVMSELDQCRQRGLLDYIGKVQTFITMTDKDKIPEKQAIGGQTFHVHSNRAELIFDN